MLSLHRILLVAGLLAAVSAAGQLDEIFSWNQLEFAWPNEQAKQEALHSGAYIPANNLPLGLARWKNKLFVTVPRWKAGVASSLNYVELEPRNNTAALIPYPSWKANIIPKDNKIDIDSVVSTFRVTVDSCDRLWVMDTGLADILGEGNQVAKPALVIYDLNTDKLIKRYEFQPSDLKEDSFFANVVVDVNPGRCDEAFAYVPDLGAYGLVVYSCQENTSWRVQHNFFHFDPLKGDFNVGGLNFQWTDGVFGLALSAIQNDGYRTMYFHPLASTKEFSVSTRVLQNKTIATDPHSYYLFKIEGEKGDLGQASASDLDETTGVVFMTQLNRDAVACWNPRKPLSPNTLALVAQDKERLIFTNDLKIDSEQNLFILSDRMPSFLYTELDPNMVNYRIFRIKVADAIRGTVCE
ncbi:PREDICTED: protein yellow-like [Nicrophorus vespilloides]|uniref:Protein yellow-like n=1 Tax=Nicrophorus vespilloides TaxID=110193 RepID=A0ABM1M4N2_NICVS|nr:PREDICTED: protein yellow-like [Nicrophorus vespilloides]